MVEEEIVKEMILRGNCIFYFSHKRECRWLAVAAAAAAMEFRAFARYCFYFVFVLVVVLRRNLYFGTNDVPKQI